MARPRIFISSTFYDLRYARVSLETFIREMGYEPVLNERGNIPYGTEELEKYCYQEVSKISMMISIIGGRFGSESRETPPYSISNLELKSAIQQGKQVYVCIDSGVYSEFSVYKRNKGKDIHYSHVDDVRVHQFIEEVYDLPRNNQIFPFGEVPQLIAYLKEQWAGILEGYLEQRVQDKTLQSISRIENSVQTLDKLITAMKRDITQTSDNQPNIAKQLDALLIQNHPVFVAMKNALKSPYRLFFTTVSEMFTWIKMARSGEDISEIDPIDDDYFEYMVNIGREQHRMDVARLLFDIDGNLKPMQPASWREEYVKVWKPQSPKPKDIDDDIPF